MPALPHLPRVHGDGDPRRRRLRVHGDVGDDGALLVLPRHHEPPHSRDPARGLPVHPRRPHRRDRHPAVLRGPAGQHRRLHLRQHARAGALALLGVLRLPAGALRLRRQGGHPADAHLAAGGAPGRALAGVGPDERRDAQDRDLRDGARQLRPPGLAPLVVGRGGARRGARHRPLRGGVRRGAGGHEAAPRLLLHREHRPHRGGPRARHHLRGLQDAFPRGAGARRGALPLPEPRPLQEPALPRHRLRAARHAGAQPRQARRAHALHAVGRVDLARGRDRERGPAAVQRLRLRVAAPAGLPLHRGAAQPVPAHAGARVRGRRRAGGGAGGLRDGEVLRHHLPGPPARGEARAGPRRRRARAPGAPLAHRRLHPAGALPRGGDRGDRPHHLRARGARARAERARGRLAAPRPRVGGARLLQPDPLPPRHRGDRRRHLRARAALLPRARAPGRAVGLRLPRADGAHAGHRRGLRPADPPDLRAVLPDDAGAAHALRHGAALQGDASRTRCGSGSTCASRS